MTTACQRLSDLSATGPQSSRQVLVTLKYEKTGTRLVDSGVLNILNTFTAGLDNDFVADMLKVMDVERDGGQRRWISCRYHQQAGPSAALVMASPQSGDGCGRSHAIGRRGPTSRFPVSLVSGKCPNYWYNAPIVTYRYSPVTTGSHW